MKQDMCKPDSILPNFQGIMVFEWLLKFVCWPSLSQKWIIAAPVEKCPSFNLILYMWKKTGYI